MIENLDLDSYEENKDILNTPEGKFILEGKEWTPKLFKTYLLPMSIQAIACTQVYRNHDPGPRHLIGKFVEGYFTTSYDPRDFVLNLHLLKFS